MTWLTLESEMLASVAYDEERQTFYLRFRTGDVYRYFVFGPDEYHAFLDAESTAASSSLIYGNASATSDWPNSAPPDRSKQP